MIINVFLTTQYKNEKKGNFFCIKSNPWERKKRKENPFEEIRLFHVKPSENPESRECYTWVIFFIAVKTCMPNWYGSNCSVKMISFFFLFCNIVTVRSFALHRKLETFFEAIIYYAKQSSFCGIETFSIFINQISEKED